MMEKAEDGTLPLLGVNPLLDAYHRIGSHALLGALDRCWTCAYGITDAPCVCDVRPLWQLSATVHLPHWEGLYDDLHVYERIESNR